MTIEVIYYPQSDTAILMRPDYPGQPTEAVFTDKRYDFADGSTPF